MNIYIGKEVTDGPMQMSCLCHANLRLLTDTVNALTSLAQHEGDACEALIRGLSCLPGEIGFHELIILIIFILEPFLRPRDMMMMSPNLGSGRRGGGPYH